MTGSDVNTDSKLAPALADFFAAFSRPGPPGSIGSR
jgi:hypothetical protein